MTRRVYKGRWRAILDFKHNKDLYPLQVCRSLLKTKKNISSTFLNKQKQPLWYAFMYSIHFNFFFNMSAYTIISADYSLHFNILLEIFLFLLCIKDLFKNI